MADSLLGDLGLQDALKYVHVNIFPSVVLLVRDCSMVLVTSATCIFFAFSLSRSVTLFGAMWILLKCGTALFSFQLVWRHMVDPFIYSKTREYVDMGKRWRRSLPDLTGGSLFSPPPREDPLAERRRGAGGGGHGGGGGGDSKGGGIAARELPMVSSGLRAASSATGKRGMELKSLLDGATVCIELRGSGSGGGEGWSEGFLYVHPHKTYETGAALGALNWGGHQITVASRASVEAICRGEGVVGAATASGGGLGGSGGGAKKGGGGGGSISSSGGGIGGGMGGIGGGGGGGGGGMIVTPEVHERESNRFLFRLHLFGTGRDITLRSESTGTLVTTFLLGVRFDRRRVVAWHRQRSSKVLTAGVSMFTPPEGGAWEEFAVQPIRRSPMGLVQSPEEEEATTAEYVICRPRDGAYWAYNTGGDEMLGFTRELGAASIFRLHPAYVEPGDDTNNGGGGGGFPKWA